MIYKLLFNLHLHNIKFCNTGPLFSPCCLIFLLLCSWYFCPCHKFASYVLKLSRDAFPWPLFSQLYFNFRYAFIRYGSADDALDAFKASVNTVIASRSIILRFRRHKGPVGPKGEKPCPPEIEAKVIKSYLFFIQRW